MQRIKRVAVAVELGVGLERHTRLFGGIVEYGRQNNWEVAVDEFPEDTLQTGKAGEQPYDGIIARTRKPLAEAAAHCQLPLVNVWLNSPVSDELPGAFIDHVAAGRMRAEHLILRGLKRFAVLGEPSIGFELSVAGFREVIAEAGFEMQSAVVSNEMARNLKEWRRTKRIVGAWIDQFETPIGVYVQADEAGRFTAQMCLRRDLRIPEDVAIIAGNNEISYCEGSNPALTSLEIGFQRQGWESARLLDRLMQGETLAKQHVYLPPLGVVARESTDFFAVDDELVSDALRFIAANSHKQIGPQDVAAAVAVSVSTIQNRFQERLGRGIATQIRQIRLDRAKREIAQSNRPLAEIARDVGFGNRIRMYAVFRRELDLTPSAYRKQLRGRQDTP